MSSPIDVASHFMAGTHQSKGLFTPFKPEGSKKISPVVKPYFISLSEQSVRDRHRCVKNAMTLRFLYTMYALTKSALRLRDVARKGFHG